MVARVQTRGADPGARPLSGTSSRAPARLVEIRQLQARLEAENIYFREEVDPVRGFDDIMGRSAAIQQVVPSV